MYQSFPKPSEHGQPMWGSSLLQRLDAGEQVICAEGYLFELERRGYLKAGAYVPEVVVDNPGVVRALHEEFVHNGSDVVEALTYYSHREKLKVIGRDDELENFNRCALRLAKQVATSTGSLMAGNISNTTICTPGDAQSLDKVKQLYKEQVSLAYAEGADYIIAETIGLFVEAQAALQSIKTYAPGLPAVITMSPNASGKTHDFLKFNEALRELEKQGADVVGLNCFRGPDTMLPIIQDVRNLCTGPVACLPVPYRTSENSMCMQHLRDQKTGERSFPADLNSWLCSRSHIADFTEKLKAMGVQYMGICCGNQAHYVRTMAETLGRRPPASKFSPDMAQHLSQVTNDGHEFASKQWHISFNPSAVKTYENECE